MTAIDISASPLNNQSEHSLFLNNGSILSSFGSNSDGQLGTNSTISNLYQTVQGLDGKNITNVFTSFSRSFVKLDNGDIYGFGTNFVFYITNQ